MPEQLPGRPGPALSFGAVAAAYDRGRPTYPEPAARWLAGDSPADVVELGAGTGKLTAPLVALGHRVHATDPDPGMLDVLAQRLPDVRQTRAGAEEIPAEDASVDVVVAGQAFHWFDHERALPEICRVLRPGGRLALVWNYRDERIPWVRRLGTLIGQQEQQREPFAPIEASGLFGEVEETAYPHWSTVDRRSIVDMVASRSNVATLDAEARDAKLAEVLAFYDDYGRGMDGMQLPYSARCFRATALPRPEAEPTPAREPEPARRHDDTGPLTGPDTGATTGPVTAAGIAFSGGWTGEDTELLLIDFS